ncbi:uncharacterized protein [Dermacentor albipictus]|uniref:uncharacterized protein n=1 Tax=Dermacentor albipictus TaxID=60249 RepID=UPI0031FD6058
MEVVEVEGTKIAPEEVSVEAGWLVSHRKQRQTTQASSLLIHGSLHATASARTESTEQPALRRRAPRQPRLPKNDIKIVIRPRDGFNVSKLGDAQIRDSILQITGITTKEAEDDIYRSCTDNNVIVVSTPMMSNAEKYCRIRSLPIGAVRYAATAYVTPPEDTAKGVIHNIPSYDTDEDITNSLIYKKNPTILQARRMGKTNSVLIVFDGKQVPYHVYYRGAEYKCYLHKKRIEVCDICGTVGHRADVCPTPTQKKCKSCDTVNPPDDHPCHPCCALCGKDHPTGDKSCHRRFQTPHLLLQRRWERLRLGQQGADQEMGPSTSANGDSALPTPKSTLQPQAPERSNPRGRSRSRERSRSRGRSQSQGRSHSGSGPDSTPPQQQGNTSLRTTTVKVQDAPPKVSWASIVSHTGHTTQPTATPVNTVSDATTHSFMQELRSLRAEIQ